MKAITVRNIDDELSRVLKEESRKKGKSINSLILESIRASYAPDSGKKAKRRWHDLDPLAGTWTDAEARQFKDATAAFGEIDSEIWK